jgi:tripartite-type tricarboxylate transporter receptor subunit TctC
MDMPDIKNRMITQGADPAYLDSEAFTTFLSKQMPVWAQAVKQSGARLD